MSKHIRAAAVAAAVGAVFAGAALPASAASTTIYGAGASAVKNAVQLLVLKDYCDKTKTISFFDNGTATIAAGAQPGGGIFAIQCTPVTTAGLTATTLTVGYDTSGGSWKAFTATNAAGLFTAAGSQSTKNANPVSTVQLTGCTVQTGAVMAVLANTFTVNYNYACAARPLVPGTDVVTFGLTDVEAPLFGAPDNQPAINGSWNTGVTGIFPTFATGAASELTGFPAQVFGVVFGVGASPALYKALQADQIASGALPSTCVAGTVSSPAATCAPNITRAQYASIVAASGSALNYSLNPLFTTTLAPSLAVFELARRDQGSGTQAAANAYFLNDGCTNNASETTVSPQLPVGSAGNVSYNATTTLVYGELLAPTLDTFLVDTVAGTITTVPHSGFAIGVISVENESKLTGGSGFLKLNGVYPSAANAANGTYTYVSEENLHFASTATGDAAVFAADLTAVSGAKVGESAKNYGVGLSANGIVGLYDATLNPNATWGNGGLLCQGWQHL